MDALEVRKAKDRSPSFPFIPLERALDRARQFYEEEKRGTAPYTRTVMHWRYSEASSGGLQTVAALKSYGLMEEVGGTGKARQLKLTELALRILLDQRPDSDERASYLRQAATSPAIALEVHQRWSDGLPSDSTLHHFLVLERKFNEQSALTATKILKQNQELTGFTSRDFQSHDEDSYTESNPTLSKKDSGGIQGEVRSRASASVQSEGHLPPIALRFKGMTITLQFSEEPTQEVFEYLERWAGFEKGNAFTKAELEAQQTG